MNFWNITRRNSYHLYWLFLLCGKKIMTLNQKMTNGRRRVQVCNLRCSVLSGTGDFSLSFFSQNVPIMFLWNIKERSMIYNVLWSCSPSGHCFTLLEGNCSVLLHLPCQVTLNYAPEQGTVLITPAINAMNKPPKTYFIITPTPPCDGTLFE